MIRHLISVTLSTFKKRLQASRHSYFVVVALRHRIATGNAGIHTACILVELLVLLVGGLVRCLREGHDGNVGRRLLHRIAPISLVIRNLVLSIFAEV